MLDLSLPDIISRIFVLVIAFTVHEFAHAWTADRFGDMTPRLNGRLTLNPLVHLDPIGSLLLIVAGFGWARPVPINPFALRRNNPAAVMWVALAGPLSNLLLAILAALIYRSGLVPNIEGSRILPGAYDFLFQFIFINILLMLFNLIPLPPLDGEKVLDFFLPPAAARVYDQIRPYGMMILLLLVFMGRFGSFSPLNFLLLQPGLAIFTFLVG